MGTASLSGITGASPVMTLRVALALRQIPSLRGAKRAWPPSLLLVHRQRLEFADSRDRGFLLPPGDDRLRLIEADRPGVEQDVPALLRLRGEQVEHAAVVDAAV